MQHSRNASAQMSVGCSDVGSTQQTKPWQRKHIPFRTTTTTKPLNESGAIKMKKKYVQIKLWML